MLCPIYGNYIAGACVEFQETAPRRRDVQVSTIKQYICGHGADGCRPTVHPFNCAGCVVFTFQYGARCRHPKRVAFTLDRGGVSAR